MESHSAIYSVFLYTNETPTVKGWCTVFTSETGLLIFCAGDQESAIFTVIISGYTKAFVHDSPLLKECHRMLKAGGTMIFRELIPDEDANSRFLLECSAKLKMGGFTLEKPKAASEAGIYVDFVAHKISFEVLLSFCKNKKKQTK